METPGVNVAIWSLPEIPRKRVVHRMKLADILELSLRSKPFHSFLKDNKLPLVELEWKFVEYDFCINLVAPRDKEPIGISFETGSDYFKDFEDSRDVVDKTEPAFTVSFCFKPNEISTADSNLKMKLMMRNKNRFSVYTCEDEGEMLKAMETLSKHLSEIAHVKYKLQCSKMTLDVFNSFVFKTTNSFIAADFGALHETDEETVPCESLTEEQLRFLLEHVEIENLLLRCKPDTLEQLKHVSFNQKSLTLDSCYWIAPSELFNNTQLEHINWSYGSSDMSEDFVRIVEAWQRGTHFQCLKQLSFSDFNEWFGGIPSGLEKRLQENLRLRSIRRTETYGGLPRFSGTLQRFWDGKEAEVVLWESRNLYYDLSILYWELAVKESSVHQ